MKGLYQFRDGDRDVDIDGLFLATPEEIGRLRKRSLSWEVAKHCNFEVDFSDCYLKLLTDDPYIVSFWENNQISVGHDPVALMKDYEAYERNE